MIRIEVETYTTSGGRRGWHKLITGIDRSKKGGFAVEGSFLDEGLQDVEEGSLILQVDPTGSVKNGGKDATLWRIVKPDDEVWSPCALPEVTDNEEASVESA